MKVVHCQQGVCPLINYYSFPCFFLCKPLLTRGPYMYPDLDVRAGYIVFTLTILTTICHRLGRLLPSQARELSQKPDMLVIWIRGRKSLNGTP